MAIGLVSFDSYMYLHFFSIIFLAALFKFQKTEWRDTNHFHSETEIEVFKRWAKLGRGGTTLRQT